MSATNVNASMTSEYKILQYPDKYAWCVLSNWLHGPQVPYLKLFSGASPMGSVKTVVQNTPVIFVRVRQNLVRRCHACIEVGGRHFEQLLDAKWYVNCVNILYLQVIVTNANKK